MDDLGSLFAGSEFPSAIDTFTDRLREAEVFSQAVTRHLTRLREEPDLPVARARDHIIAFHGIGGLGKTKLSERLEDWIVGNLGDDTDWGSPPKLGRPVLTTRIDMDERQGLNLERAVLQLRATAGSISPRCPAFDIALSAWWEQVHGTRAVPALRVARSSRRGGDSVEVDVADQIRDTTTAVLEELGAGLGLANLGIRVVKRIKSGIVQRRVLAQAMEIPAFAQVMAALEDGADMALLSRLPVLLGADMRRVPPPERPLWIVFADTFEYVNDSPGRVGEAEFQRLVIGLPDVLWVISGRSRLDWADERRKHGLDRVGGRHWPGLDPLSADSRQHLVGDLSDEDARRFLIAATEDLPGAPVSNDLIDAIVGQAAGWPLYLDRAVQLVRERALTGEVLSPEAFDISFSDLVERVIRDLPDDEEFALRLACLFPRFSPALVADASEGRLPEAEVHRLRERGLVSLQAWPLFDYKVHDSLRAEVLRQVPEHGGWTDTDWARAAQRAMEVIREMFGVETSVDHRLDCFSLAMSVALDFGLDADWLINAAGSLPTMHQAAEALPPVPARADESWAGHFAAVLNCWRVRAEGKNRNDLLADVIESRDLPPSVYATAQRFRAYGLRNRGRLGEALEILDLLLVEGAPGELVNVRQRSFMLSQSGRFREAVAMVDAAPAMGMSEPQIAVMNAGPALRHGRVVEAADLYGFRSRHLSSEGKLRLARENRGDELAALALSSPPPLAATQQFVEIAGAVAFDNTYRAACYGFALATAGSDSFGSGLAQLREAFELPPPMGDSDHASVWRLEVAPAFDAAVRTDVAALAKHWRSITTQPVWHVVVGYWLSLVDPTSSVPHDDLDWVEPRDTVEARWQKLVVDRRVATGRDPTTGHLSPLEQPPAQGM